MFMRHILGAALTSDLSPYLGTPQGQASSIIPTYTRLNLHLTVVIIAILIVAVLELLVKYLAGFWGVGPGLEVFLRLVCANHANEYDS